MRVVVTGGAGFIGANLCRELLSRPEITEVVALDDLSSGFEENLHPDATFVHGSVPKSWKARRASLSSCD